MPARFVAKNPALAPLFAAVGFAIAGSGWFAFNVLKNDPVVVLNKQGEQDPWNQVKQHQNTKLYSPNSGFWQERVGVPDPRAAFLSSDSSSASQRAKDKVNEIKARGVGNREH
ncbi:hypothetical protein M407DRAFT_242911 [Tulasnella calospora MUT 4182]|uniref:Uncharacterized protein n=1 Tax=Tulasnella calospora MUT 4182 TaxID=1051891 RepID=A0A0C3QLX0_9AGAM|nr:hypothetical protein M407DRAFT_242911 [Tulasnella calospora MUT 4182]